MAQVRPALTVDVNAAQNSQRRTGASGKGMNVQSVVSAQAPSNLNKSAAYQADPADRRNGGSIRPGDIISEDDLAAQGGFSSDEEGDDVFDVGSRPVNAMNDQIAIIDPSHPQSRTYAGMSNQDFIHSDSSEEENYGPDAEGEMVSDEDDGQYDEDEDDDLSSSPSIPDENIDFDLVYALHNFIATVEGQATVNKGNSLTLLDDSNSYWWLVRVLRTQEVGYIPAENIETPYERLARLNKHRNVDLTSATDDDHIQVPENIITSHLVKQRSFGSKGFSSHSGKLSALSRRNHGPKPSRPGDIDEGKRGVQFGPPTYLEHSGNEYSDEDDEDDYDDEEDDEDEYDDEQEEMEEDDRAEASAAGTGEASGLGGGEETAAHQRAWQQGRSNVQQMEPDDGMDWDGRETERAQRAQEERNAARQAAENRMAASAGPVGQAAQSMAQANASSAQLLQQGGPQPNQRQQQQQPYQQQQQQQQPNAHIASNAQSSMAQQQHPSQSQGPYPYAGNSFPHTDDQAHPRTQQNRNSRQMQNRNSDRLSTSTMSSNGSAASFLPSHLQAARERGQLDNSQQGPSGTLSPDAKRDKRSSHRKSRGEDGDGGDEKQSKKRSGVFSGLFSRSKDKKDRKSGHSSQGSVDSDLIRTSEDSTRISKDPNGVSLHQVSSAGRNVHERDRVHQEAYQRQFLQDTTRTDNRSARPGSLIATPGTAPMLNVLRVFASEDLESSVTFKTVLLNQSTTANELLKQSIQRFRLGNHGHNLGDFYLTIKLVEGDERVLEASERPLQVFDQLTEALTSSNQDVMSTIPSVKRSSVGSISSISSNLSLNPAIARLHNDFSDDHHVKFYLHRKVGQDAVGAYASPGQSAAISPHAPMSSSTASSRGDPTLGQTQAMGGNGAGHSFDEGYTNVQNMRFPLRLLIFPSDLPDGLVFDPQTNALVPLKTLQTRGPAGQAASEGISQDYREKILALPRNTTVAEVIEQGLERFGILDGVVEGGDDVEDRSSRRRSKPRFRYGLSVKAGSGERSLQPSSKVLEAFSSPPTMRAAQANRRSKRNSADSAMLLNFADDLRSDDPIFILRQVQRHHQRTSRPLSPTENILASKDDERRVAELGTVAPKPSARALDEVRSPADLEQPGMSRQELIAAQRAAARERRAAVLGSQPNDENGVDVMLNDRSRLRSSKMIDTGKVRYSFIPVSGEEHDISAIVEDVLQAENATMDGLLAAPRPSLHSMGSGSVATNEDFVSAPASPVRNTPLSLSEVNATIPGAHSDDILERLMRENPTNTATVEDRIDQVLSRLGGGSRNAPSNIGRSAQANGEIGTQPANHIAGGSTSSSHETASPISGNTHASGTTTPTPLSMLTTAGAAMTALPATHALRPSDGATSARSVPPPTSMTGTNDDPTHQQRRTKTSSPVLAISDFGIAHLYAVAEAAARKKPPRKRPSKSYMYDAGSQPYSSSSASMAEDELQPSIAGLFAPLAPHIEDRRIKEAYAPIGRHLNGLEETLDRLLNDTLRL